MATKARIGVIGTGWWSTTVHIPTLQMHPDADLVALADLRSVSLEKAAAAYQVDKTYVDYRCNRAHSFGDCPSPSLLEGRIREVVIPQLGDVRGKKRSGERFLNGACQRFARADNQVRSGSATYDSLHS